MLRIQASVPTWKFGKKPLTRTYQGGCMCEHDHDKCSSQFLFGKQFSWVLWFANAIVRVNYYLNHIMHVDPQNAS